MITYKAGNIFDQDVEAIVNPVNCIGIAGAGLALKLKVKYPDNHHAYTEACKFNCIDIGKVFAYRLDSKYNPKFIINFPTKNHWKYSSEMSHIKSGLQSLYPEIIKRKIKSIAIPMLGCGLGGLDWKMVKGLMESEYKRLTKPEKKKLDNVDIVVMENL